LDLPRDLASKVLANAAEALGLVSDEKGETNSTVWLTLTKSHPEKVPARIVFLIPANPGRMFCRAALCNIKTGYGARGGRPLTVPEAGGEAVRLDPVLLLTEPRLEETYASPGASLEDLYGYDAMKYSVLTGNVPAGTKTLRAAVRATSVKPGTEIEMIARLKRPNGGEALPIPVTVLRESTDVSTKKICLELETGKLEPGLYLLFLNVREKNGSGVVGTTTTFTVK
ncbi:MAG: hypothetical protein ACYDH3_12110, partial [Candidatus Aminicenantales bacterium]